MNKGLWLNFILWCVSLWKTAGIQTSKPINALSISSLHLHPFLCSSNSVKLTAITWTYSTLQLEICWQVYICVYLDLQQRPGIMIISCGGASLCSSHEQQNFIFFLRSSHKRQNFILTSLLTWKGKTFLPLLLTLKAKLCLLHSSHER